MNYSLIPQRKAASCSHEEYIWRPVGMTAGVLCPCSRVQLPGPSLTGGTFLTIKLAREKRPALYTLIQKTKLWPSRRGTLHGVKHAKLVGSYLKIETFCNMAILTRNSRRSRATRWLRSGWAGKVCKTCKIPKWRLSKYSSKFK